MKRSHKMVIVMVNRLSFQMIKSFRIFTKWLDKPNNRHYWRIIGNSVLK